MSVRIISSRRLRMRSGSPPAGMEKSVGEGIDIFLSKRVLSKIAEESISELAAGKEVMGLLYGTPFSYRGRVMLTICGLANLPTVANSHHVSVDHDSSAPIHQEGIEGSVVVGWYHSHTGVGNFMSATDEFTHRRWFDSQYSVSMVYEAAEKSISVYRLKDGALVSVGYAEYSD